MLKKSKQIFITTEKHEIFIARNGHRAIQGFCSDCQTEVEMLNLDLAVTHSGKTVRELLELIECGAIHSTETTDGHLLVCRNSLLAKSEEI